MARILVDANVLLPLYATRLERVQAHLNLLRVLRSEIFVSEQVCLEVERNRVAHGRALFAQLVQDFPTNRPFNLPQNFAEELRREIHTAGATVADLRDRLIRAADEQLTAIRDGLDPVSQAVLQLTWQPAQDELLARARTRRERGQPPGKRADPLGDQLTWEQFVAQLSAEETDVWVVTRDGDYFEDTFANSHEPLLKATLQRELRERAPRVVVRAFKEWSLAAQSYLELNPGIPMAAARPTDEQTQEAAAEESRAAALPLWPPGEFSRCPACGSTDLSGANLRSRFGGLTWHQICRSCGHRHDTGDFFD